MNEQDELSAFERRILNEIDLVEARIAELHAEKSVLMRQLAKARSEKTGLQAVTRRNSLNRVMAESSILGALRMAEKPLTTKQLHQRARLTNYGLKETTFRTYLHRMKRRRLIKTAHHVGYWDLPPEPVENPSDPSPAGEPA